ncbi:hypothetical protein Poly51_56120 [Rubripirellula tenax]|uniref:Uncharacterized protein n=1 Tax=Rubripirellula tenax TaxID=2528015 RepID=A0A5C6EF52_9BACT|nr:hypothetical protein [Rubripirellula tenax]TWU46216.1 hypothetical protein Poly51_56120 [Rubripirellula tenax]
MIARHRALALLQECTGETLWPIDHCRLRGVPEPWIAELTDTFESGFDNDRDTIYANDISFAQRQPTNQFHGIRDVDLAMRLGRELGVDVQRLQSTALGRATLVAAIKQTLMDGE